MTHTPSPREASKDISLDGQEPAHMKPFIWPSWASSAEATDKRRKWQYSLAICEGICWQPQTHNPIHQTNSSAWEIQLGSRQQHSKQEKHTTEAEKKVGSIEWVPYCWPEIGEECSQFLPTWKDRGSSQLKADGETTITTTIVAYYFSFLKKVEYFDSFLQYSIQTKTAARSGLVVPVHGSSKHSHCCPSLSKPWEKLLQGFKTGKKLTLNQLQIILCYFQAQGQTSTPAGLQKGAEQAKQGHTALSVTARQHLSHTARWKCTLNRFESWKSVKLTLRSSGTQWEHQAFMNMREKKCICSLDSCVGRHAPAPPEAHKAHRATLRSKPSKPSWEEILEAPRSVWTSRTEAACEGFTFVPLQKCPAKRDPCLKLYEKTDKSPV